MTETVNRKQDNNFITSFFQSMDQLNQSLLTTLCRDFPQADIDNLRQKFMKERQQVCYKIGTPGTNSTMSSLKHRGPAVRRIAKRKQEQQQGQAISEDLGLEGPATSTHLAPFNQHLKFKAVFYGDKVELPYLHSSDAVNHLYSRSKITTEQVQPLINVPTAQMEKLLRLKSLNIYHCRIDSLRQLGTGWSNLKELSIFYGQLTDLGGLSSFPALQYMFLPFNRINSLSDIMFQSGLKGVDLQRNRIEDLQEAQYLYTLDKLEWVNLNSNPIMHQKESRRKILQELKHIIDPEECTKLQDYIHEENQKNKELLMYDNIQHSNWLMKVYHEQATKDEIRGEDVYNSITEQNSQQEALQFIEYKECSGREDEDGQNTEVQLRLTPLVEFLPSRCLTKVLTKYLDNKLLKNVPKKAENSLKQMSRLGGEPLIGKLSLGKRLSCEKSNSESKPKTRVSLSTKLKCNQKGNLQSLASTSKTISNPFSQNSSKTVNSSFSPNNSKPLLRRTFLFKKNATGNSSNSEEI